MHTLFAGRTVLQPGTGSNDLVGCGCSRIHGRGSAQTKESWSRTFEILLKRLSNMTKSLKCARAVFAMLSCLVYFYSGLSWLFSPSMRDLKVWQCEITSLFAKSMFVSHDHAAHERTSSSLSRTKPWCDESVLSLRWQNARTTDGWNRSSWDPFPICYTRPVFWCIRCAGDGIFCCYFRPDYWENGEPTIRLSSWFDYVELNFIGSMYCSRFLMAIIMSLRL